MFEIVSPDRMVQGDTIVFRLDQVVYIDISNIECEIAYVQLQSRPELVTVSGFNALELSWLLKAGSLEGKRVKFPKHTWIIHNLLAHPIMQLLAFCRCYKAAMWVHDSTVPKPLSRR